MIAKKIDWGLICALMLFLAVFAWTTVAFKHPLTKAEWSAVSFILVLLYPVGKRTHRV